VTVGRKGSRGEQERCWKGLRLAIPDADDAPGYLHL
jgi:hypothetical protein